MDASGKVRHAEGVATQVEQRSRARNSGETAVSPRENPSLVTDDDRQLIRREQAAFTEARGGGVHSAASPRHRTWSHGSPGKAASPAHPKAKFLLKSDGVGSPSGVGARGRPPPGVLSVADDAAVMKEWSGVRGSDTTEAFKSPSLFWEIRLKESKVRTADRSKKQSPFFQIIEACDMLNQFSGRDAASLDPAVLDQVKEQIFSAIFADYATNKQKGTFRTKLDLLRACVPYAVVAERQFSELQRANDRVSELEKKLFKDLEAKSCTSSSTQTVEDELNKVSGVDKLLETVEKLQIIVNDLNAEKFTIKLEAEEKVSKSTAEMQSLRDQLERVFSRSEAVMSEAELIRADAEMAKDKKKELEDHNEILHRRCAELDQVLQGVRREYKEFSSQVTSTLETERWRFKQERAWWLDSFVAERYEWLNQMESAQKRIEQASGDVKKKSKRQEMEEEADKSILWSALTRLDEDTRGQLESLYWEQDGGTDKVKIQDTKEYTGRVWDVLQQHECAIESLLLDSAVVKRWNNSQAAGAEGGSSPARR